MSDPVVCTICGFPKGETPKEQKDPIKSQEEERTEALIGGFQRAYHKADAAVVYILGYKTREGGTTARQIDSFSILNGYHLCSMPDRRYKNPVLVGAGGGLVAVVDRFQDVDVIRVTDPYFGLDESDFNDLGIPDDTIDLSKVNDLLQITAPTGSRVTGLTIMPRGILIANLTKEDGVPCYLKVDVYTTLGQETQPGFNGVDTLEDPFSSWGNMVGAPAPYDIALGSHMMYFATIISDGTRHGVALVDLLQGTVIAYVGLPDKYTPLTVAHSQGVIHVLVQDEEALTSDNQLDPPFGNKVLRIPILYDNYMMSGGIENDEMILEPQDFSVSRTFQPKDAVSEQDINLPAYLEGTRQLNSNYDETVLGAEVTAADVEITSPSGLAEGQSESTSTELANRPQTNDDEAPSSTYDDNRNIPVKVITLPADRRVFALGTSGNTLIEGGYDWDASDTETPRDTSRPLFFAFHNSHYDYLSDGGFIYGCTKEVEKVDGNGDPVIGPDGEPETEYKSVVVTGDFTPIAMGFDSLVKPGELRTLPDMGVVLVDNVTNRAIYRHPKNLGMKVYSGSYASVKKADGNKVLRSLCSDEADNVATTLDGIKRPVSGAREPERDPEPHIVPGYSADYYPVDAYGNSHEYDLPFELLDRSAVPGSDTALIQLIHGSWSMRENDPSAFIPALLPEWRDGLIFDIESPISIDKNSENGETFWRKASSSSNDPSFVASAAGGFWFLDLMKNRTRLKDELQEDLIELQDELDALNTEKQAYEDELNGDPAPSDERKTELQSLIASLDSAITSKENQIAAKEDAISNCGDDFDSNPVLFRTPRNILNQVYKLEPHSGQSIDPVEGTDSIHSVTPNTDSAGTWEPCTCEITRQDAELNTEVTEEKKCGIVIDPGIRSWIGIEIKGNYWGVYVNGNASYYYDETLENGLGRCIGVNRVFSHSPGDNPFNWVDGSKYEAGYICSPWGNGAWGRFEVLVEFNNKPAKEIATRVTYLEQITEQAPEELQTRLYADMTVTADDVENGTHYGRVYFSDEVIKKVRIRVRLINYATDVFRVGFNTLSIDHPWSFNCPGYDPGYLAGNNCEGMACGNLTCTSVMFGGDHKLESGDPVYPLTRQLVWEGEAIYTIEDSDNPYLAQGLQVGYFMDCYFNIDLMAPMTAYRVDISQDTYQPESSE